MGTLVAITNYFFIKYFHYLVTFINSNVCFYSKFMK